MKLNIDKSFIDKPRPVKVKIPNPQNDYRSPINWWSVTTEGDCEGRSRTALGIWYGHVAEIAFSLADKVCYELDFAPASHQADKGQKPKIYQARRKEVCIGLGIESNTWPSSESRESRPNWFRKWLNCDDIIVKESCYYKAVSIVLK